jgi:DNA-directed RNA polymerases I, II, and III subunit RPABC2
MSYSDDEEEDVLELKPTDIKIKMDLGEAANDDDTEVSEDDDSDLDSENSPKIRVKSGKDDMDSDEDDGDMSRDDDIESLDDLEDYDEKIPSKQTKGARDLPDMDLPSEDDDDDQDDDQDEEDENYLQKFDESIKQSIISEYHPELHQHNYEEVEALATVVRNELGVIVDPLHKTLPFLTKYEKARVLGERAKQINAGGQPFVEVDASTIDGYLIAMQELEQKKIPFILKRPLPNGGCEYWRLKDLEILV